MAEESAWQSVLDFLEHFRRPSAAVWTGLSSAGTDEGFLEGARKGWMLEPGAKELADVIGIPEGQPDDPWAPWLMKEGSRLVASAAGDPLTWMFAPAKAKGVIGPAIKAFGVPEGKSIAGRALEPLTNRAMTRFESSPWFKQVGHRLSTMPEVEEDLQRISREGSAVPLKELADTHRTQLASKLEELGGKYTAEDVFDALEFGTKDKDLQSLADIVEPLRGKRNEIWNTKNRLREEVRFEKKASIAEEGYSHMPRTLTDSAMRNMLRLGDASVNPEAWKEASRQLFRWVDEEGNVVHVGKETDKGLKKVRPVDPDTGKEITDQGYRYLWEGKPVTRKQAGLKDVQPLMGERSFISNPVDALERQMLRDQADVNMLEMLKSGVQRGDIVHTGLDQAAPGMRQLRMVKEGVKNRDPWEIYSADPRVANRLENLMDAGEGVLFEILDKINASKAGQIGNQLQDLWKREILTNFGFYTGNEVSAIGSLYSDGVAAHKIIPRIMDAIKIRKGTDSRVFSSWENKDLLQFLQRSGISRSGWAGTMEKKHALEQSIEDFIPNWKGKETVQKGAKKWDEAKDWMFKNLGSEPEDNAKMARFVDFIKENHPNFDTMPKDEQLKIMDKAVLRSKDALIDYTNLAPTEKRAQFFVPFLAWMRGIGGLTAEQAVQHPDRFGRMARFLDNAFEPLPADEKEQADAWVRDNSPVTGFMGMPFPQDQKGNQNMLMLNRFIPQGNIEQAINRSGAFAMGALSPMAKVPMEALSNWSFMKDEPIDRLSKGVLSPFYAPITQPVTGAPYEKNKGLTFGAQLPAGWDYLLNQSPAGRHVRTVNDAARSLGLFEDPYKPAPGDEGLASKVGGTLAQTVTGSRFYGYDPAKYQRKRKQEKDRNIRQVKSNMKWARIMGDEDGTEYYQGLLSQMMQNPGIFLENN